MLIPLLFPRGSAEVPGLGFWGLGGFGVWVFSIAFFVCLGLGLGVFGFFGQPDGGRCGLQRASKGLREDSCTIEAKRLWSRIR